LFAEHDYTLSFGVSLYSLTSTVIMSFRGACDEKS
jgi:hypothetical protein